MTTQLPSDCGWHGGRRERCIAGAVLRLVVFSSINAQTGGAGDRQRLLGVWRVVSVEAAANGAVSNPLGRKPTSLLTLTPVGDWSPQLLGENHASATGDPRVTYRAHSGTFTVDSDTLLVLHRNGNLAAAGIGSDTPRYDPI